MRLTRGLQRCLIAGTAVLLIFPMASPTLATGKNGTSLNECTRSGFGGGIKVYARDDAKGRNRVLCVPMRDASFGSRGRQQDRYLDRREPQRGRLEDIWNGMARDIESMKVRVAGGCRIQVEATDRSQTGSDRVFEKTFYKSPTPRTRFVEIRRRNDNRITGFELEVSCFDRDT